MFSVNSQPVKADAVQELNIVDQVEFVSDPNVLYGVVIPSRKDLDNFVAAPHCTALDYSLADQECFCHHRGNQWEDFLSQGATGAGL